MAPTRRFYPSLASVLPARYTRRAFDWRPRLAADNRTLQMHHGDVVIEHSMGDALDAMLAWARANGSDPSGADLIVLGITDCAADDGLTGADCVAATRRELDARGIAHVSDCAELAGLSVAAAFERGRLPGQGGAILAIFDCWEQNYDPSVACSGFGGSSDGDAEVQHPADGDDGLTYTCYGDSASRDIPLRSMWAYLNRTAAAGPPTDGRLWATQALWQESAESVVVGELHGSSLLQDEQRSRLNSLLAQSIASGAWPPDPQQPLNLVEVNNVCDAGEELLYALRKRLGGVDAATRLAQPAQTNSASRARQPTALTDQELM